MCFPSRGKKSKRDFTKGGKMIPLLIIREIQIKTVNDRCTYTNMAKVESQNMVKGWLHQPLCCW